MAASFGGHPLLLEDPGGELRDWMNRFQSLDDLQCFGEPPALASSFTHGRGPSGIGLPRPNYPPAPRPKLNTLYWPSGAARWARGFFICDGATKDKIVTDAHGSSNTPLTLKLDDEVNEPVETSMYLLTPRPLTCVQDAPPEESLWLLPLVDERYWWQFKHMNTEAFDATTTWAALFTAIGTRLGGSIEHVDISADYLKPDAKEFTRRYGNAAVVLDAAAHSVGLRVHRLLSGAVKAVGAATADTQITTNLEGTWYQQAGNDFGTKKGNLPAEVVVAFPKKVGSAIDRNGVLYAYTKTDDTEPVMAGYSKVIRSTSFADFATEASATPDNNTELDTLAAKVKEDYYLWLGKQFDYTFAGAFPWSPTAHDDHVEYCLGRQESDRRYSAYTRVQGVAYNFGVEEMLHQGQPVEEKALFIEYTATAAFASNESAAATVNSYSQGPDPDPDSLGVTIKDPQNLAGTAPIGFKGVAYWNAEAEEYRNLTRFTKVVGTGHVVVSDNGSGTFTVSVTSGPC